MAFSNSFESAIELPRGLDTRERIGSHVEGEYGVKLPAREQAMGDSAKFRNGLVQQYLDAGRNGDAEMLGHQTAKAAEQADRHMSFSEGVKKAVGAGVKGVGDVLKFGKDTVTGTAKFVWNNKLLIAAGLAYAYFTGFGGDWFARIQSWIAGLPDGSIMKGNLDKVLTMPMNPGTLDAGTSALSNASSAEDVSSLIGGPS